MLIKQLYVGDFETRAEAQRELFIALTRLNETLSTHEALNLLKETAEALGLEDRVAILPADSKGNMW